MTDGVMMKMERK